MWATLALAAALLPAPAQSGALQLKNDRMTYGPLGQERKDAKFLPGDVLHIAFDIDGLKTGEDGKVRYSMTLDVQNKDGKSQFKQQPQEMDAVNALGGNSVPGTAYTVIGTDTAPGEYGVAITVKDLASEKSQTITRKFEVLPRGFGIIRPQYRYLFPNNGGFPDAPAVGVAGQTYIVDFSVVGFELDKQKKVKPNIDLTLRVIDDTGKPVLAKPFSGAATEVLPEIKSAIPMQFVLALNRAGKFKVELKAVDKVAGKTAEQVLDLTVLEPK